MVNIVICKEKRIKLFLVLTEEKISATSFGTTLRTKVLLPRNFSTLFGRIMFIAKYSEKRDPIEARTIKQLIKVTDIVSVSFIMAFNILHNKAYFL